MLCSLVQLKNMQMILLMIFFFCLMLGDRIRLGSTRCNTKVSLNGEDHIAPCFFFGRAVHGLCCRQNSWRVFKNRTASVASADMFSEPVSARFKSGCLSKFSRYSLSTHSSPSNLRASNFSGLTLDGHRRMRVADLAVRRPLFFGSSGRIRAVSGCLTGTELWKPPIVFSIASCVFCTPNRNELSSGRSRRPRWKNIRLISNWPRK